MKSIEKLADALERRAFLYDDPASYREGVREMMRALRAALEQQRGGGKTREAMPA